MRTSWWSRLRRDHQPSEPRAASFRSLPYVCGAIGTIDVQRVHQLRAHAPTSLRELHQSSSAVLLASHDLPRWQRGDTSGLFWSPMADGDEPTSWESAATGRVAAGLQHAHDATILHTDALGLQDVYTRRIGDALYFSVRIDPLVHLDDLPLHADWTAWADIYAVTSPLAESTPFEEIRRMGAATGWRADAQGLRQTRFDASWLAAEPDGSVSPENAVDAVRRCMPETSALSITLSGGWDSRLLAVLAREQTDRVVAWTTSGDDGWDHDLRLAGPVAAALDIEHHVLEPGMKSWAGELSTVRRRLDFQTPHHVWFMPLAHRLHDRTESFLDGLAGDVLFKSLFVNEALAATSDPVDRDLLWRGLSQSRTKRAERFAPGVMKAFEERSRESLDRVAARFDGHPAAATLSVLHTRTARAIATSPLRLLAPEVDVRVPFAHPDVVAAALRVHSKDKVGGGFYRDMMIAANPSVAALPSTNDGMPKGPRGKQRQTRPAALRTMADTIARDETVSGLLGPDIRRALVDADELRLIGGAMRVHRVLNWASLFAEWRATYADVLAADDAPT